MLKEIWRKIWEEVRCKGRKKWILIWTTINDFRLIKIIFFDYYCLRSFKVWNMPVQIGGLLVNLSGYRCQISREYQRPDSCNKNIDLTGWVRMASWNDDIRCCYGGKCCKRYSNRQVDTCSYPSYIGHYQGIPYVVCWSTVTHKERPIDHICEVCHGNNGSLMSSV